MDLSGFGEGIHEAGELDLSSVLRGKSSVFEMNTSPTAMTEFMVVGGPASESQVRNQDADYIRLGHDEDDDLEIEEFELSAVEVDKYRKRKLLWWLKIIFGGLILLAGTAAFVFWGIPFILDKILIPLLVWEASTFSRPVLATVLVLSLAFFPVFILPSGPSMWLSGMIFGWGYGFLIIMAGTTVGQTFPYVIGRWLLHDRIQKYLLKWPKQSAILSIAEQGNRFYQFRTIAVLRVSPFPYPLFNYAVTGTNITFGPYITGSIAGMVPEAFITIYSGKMLKDLADLKHNKLPLTWPKILYYTVSGIIALSIGIAVTILGRRALKDLEIREAAGRANSETRMHGELENFSSSNRGIQRSMSWNGDRELEPSSVRKKVERELSHNPRH